MALAGCGCSCECFMLLEVKPLLVFVQVNNLYGIGHLPCFLHISWKQTLTLESTEYVGGAVRLDVLVAVPFMLPFM